MKLKNNIIDINAPFKATQSNGDEIEVRFNLNSYGLEDDEIELEPDRKKQQSLYSKLRKQKKDFSQNKFAFDPNDRMSDLDRNANKLDAIKGQDKDLLE